MKIFVILFAALASLNVSAETTIEDFFIGKYLLVGKGVESSNAYTGNVEFYRHKGSLKFKRIVNNISTIGDAAVEDALMGEAKVLRLNYEVKGEKFEQTCLWQSDLDNYARISCYLYNPGIATKNPGLEVLFHDHAQE